MRSHWICAFLLVIAASARARAETALTHVDVFVSGEDGYHTYRIPAIETAPDGSLLAFAEARKYNAGDPGMENNEIDLVCKRSTDGGRTWSAPRPGLPVSPVCCAIERFTLKSAGDDRDRILWTGPKGPGRNNLVVRVSYDECRTFPNERLIAAGPAAYSDLAILKDKSAGVLWERGGYRMCNAKTIGPWLGTVLAAASLGAAMSQAAAPPFKLFAASDTARVFEDGYGTPQQLPAEIRVFGLRNEVISAQCVLRADEDLHEATVSVGPLRRADGAAIAAENVLWNFVESIFIEKNTPKLRKSDLVRPAPARFPDCLSEARRVSLAKGSQKAVYLTVRIPRSAEPGAYRAEVTARSGAGVACLPLSLTVYPLVLPDQRHVMATEWFSTNQFQRWHGIDSSDSPRFLHMLGIYAQNMADHRQNVFRLSLGLIRSTLADDGKLQSDFSQFDRWAKVFWDTGRMDLLETGFVAEPGKGGWSSREIRLSDFEVKDALTGKSKRLSGREFLPQFLPALVEHLRERGWLEKTVFHICDEPADHNAMAWREASEFVHRCALQLRRIDAIENPHCMGRLEVWVPKLDHLADWQEAFEAAQRGGNEMWFYTVGIFQGGSLPNKTVDVPLIESRLMHWLNYRYGLKGYLHWGFNEWTNDPIDAPGEHRGDGWQVYPKRDGLLNSLRWEQMRNGLEDYECLWLLENEISRIKATLSPRIAALIEPARRGMEIASQVVPAYGDCRRDPEVLYAARRQAIEETIGLAAAPHMIVQTNPAELAGISADCRIDVHGWAEPGTRIEINGNPVPVAADGLFLQAMTVSKQGTIRVEAVKGQDHKTMLRKFRVQK